MKKICTKIIPVILIVAMLSGCASVGTQKKSPLQAAQTAYVEGAIGYKVAKTVIESAREQHCGQVSCVPDNVWNMAISASRIAQAEAPVVEGLLVQWQVTGVKPSNLDSAQQILTAAFESLKSIQANTAGGR